MDKPTALREMKQMTKEEFEEVDDFLYNGSLSPKRLIKHIILLSDKEISWQGKENSNSLREFWYNPTKGIVEEAFPEKLTEWGSSKFNRRMSQYLSTTLSELVKNPTNNITYRGLNILDDSRDRALTTFSVEKDKILFVEKDSAYRKLKPLQEVYEINIVSGSGWEATALLEDLKYELEPDIDYTLWVVSDYDPTGFRIADDFRKRAEQLGLNFKEVDRIGINPDQVPDRLVEEQKFTVPVKSDYDRRWIDRYGIGDKGLEIEAVGDDPETKGRDLRKVIVKELEDRINEEERYRYMVEISIASIHEMSVNRIFKRITGELKDSLKQLAIEISGVKELEGVDLKDTDLGFEATLDSLETVIESDNEFLPIPPKEGELHNRAVNIKTDLSGKAQPPHPKEYKAKNKLERKMRKAIASGDFEIREHIDLEE